MMQKVPSTQGPALRGKHSGALRCCASKRLPSRCPALSTICSWLVPVQAQQVSRRQTCSPTLSSPSNWCLIPSTICMVALERKCSAQKARSRPPPAWRAATHPLKAVTSARWSLAPPAPSARRALLAVAACRAAASTGSTQGSLQENSDSVEFERSFTWMCVFREDFGGCRTPLPCAPCLLWLPPALLPPHPGFDKPAGVQGAGQIDG